MIKPMTYEFVVEYKKQFTNGSLIGITVPCTVGFPTKNTAEYFCRQLVKSDNHKDLITGDQWNLVGHPVIIV